jgi:type III pantothenate kinase
LILTVDIGNSHTVFGLWQSENLSETIRVATEPRRTSDEWRLILRAWLAEHGSEISINRAAVCSVVPAANEAINEALANLGARNPHWITQKSQLNFGFNYAQPQTLGADRIVDLIAARHFFGENCIVLDFGTAITFSVLTAGAFEGGVIAPGITSSLDALFNATAKLPKIAFHRTERTIGKTTSESIEAGAYIGWRGLVREILNEVKRELPEVGKRHKVVATGGISQSLDFAPEFFDVVDKNLTLKGLYIAATKLVTPS